MVDSQPNIVEISCSVAALGGFLATLVAAPRAKRAAIIVMVGLAAGLILLFSIPDESILATFRATDWRAAALAVVVGIPLGLCAHHVRRALVFLILVSGILTLGALCLYGPDVFREQVVLEYRKLSALIQDGALRLHEFRIICAAVVLGVCSGVGLTNLYRSHYNRNGGDAKKRGRS